MHTERNLALMCTGNSPLLPLYPVINYASDQRSTSSNVSKFKKSVTVTTQSFHEPRDFLHTVYQSIEWAQKKWRVLTPLFIIFGYVKSTKKIIIFHSHEREQILQFSRECCIWTIPYNDIGLSHYAQKHGAWIADNNFLPTPIDFCLYLAVNSAFSPCNLIILKIIITIWLWRILQSRH